MSTGAPLITERDSRTNTGTQNVIPDVMDTSRWLKAHGPLSAFQIPNTYQAPDLDGAVAVAQQQAAQLQNRASSGFTTQNPFEEVAPRLFTAEERQSLLVMSLGGGLLALLVFSFFSGKPLIE